MHLSRRILLQLAIFTVIALIAITVMALKYVNVPAKWFGVGRYTVTMQLLESGGLYGTGNVTYRGVEVGRVQSVHLTDTGVEAELSLKSGIDIPSEVNAEVHSQSAIGEQYVELIPRNGSSRPLAEGDVIPRSATSVPPDINSLLDSAKSGLEAIPRDNLKTVIDEAYTAVGGLGQRLSEIVKGSTTLSIDAHANLDPLINLIDNAKPVLDSQSKTAQSIQAWASHLATVTRELEQNNDSVVGLIENGGPGFDRGRQLIDRLRPTLPILTANLASAGQVAVTYQNDIEQLLVLLPHAVSAANAGLVANANTTQPYKGQYLSFNLNINLPPPCTTGFLPAQQARIPTEVDAPERTPGDLYCRTPQDSPFNVRGARNIPCETVPGKRAPTVTMCEGDEQYVPLNDGYNWKGDPNATTTGQDIPQNPHASTPPDATLPTAAPPPALIGVTEYDPATGSYIGPNGRLYSQTDLAPPATQDHTWQSLLLPPGS